ncbi:Lcl C-terminal domain-containing protein [Alteromonas oceanisediminis]|uniref:Lcl C-terminal domain-containing protein n=1 Tax=Alteromonas oceanisediminis TaxID=2836180 RepID=UPI001BDA7A69|nr:DUF1566 domain-containing protein [Alteromonas oceanisediminis]MBT0585099.1 DUF1566 domain-containing protein [Alteromonas oceanisediminis]
MNRCYHKALLRFCLLGVLSVSSSVFAQTCLSNIEPTTPSAEFESISDNQVKHLRTGLVWMRCAIGQTYDGTQCSGDAQQMTWEQALQLAHGYRFDDTQGWRLPNIKELATLTERSCVRPAINTDVFPNTPPDDFWTSTPAVTDAERAWVVAYFNSSNSIKDKQRFVFVRLVRTALADE